MRDSKEYTVMSAKAATGVGNTIFGQDFRYIEIEVASASSANLTVKFAGSNSETAPDFAAAQSATNIWDYIQVKDLEDGSSVDGDTGLALSGTDDFRRFEINTNGPRWFTAIVTAYSAGNVTVKTRLFNEG